VISSFAFDVTAKADWLDVAAARRFLAAKPRSKALEMQVFLSIEQNCKFRSDSLAITLKSR
jgi:hypothetical protein